MAKKITVIGSGAMGTAVAKILYENKHDVIIYGINENELEELKIGKNSKYFNDEINLPFFQISNNLKKSINFAEYIVLAIPSQFIVNFVQNLINITNKNIKIINVSKGLDPASLLPLHTSLEKINSGFSIATIIGPGHAEDIVKKSFISLSVIGENQEFLKEVKKIFDNHYCKLIIEQDKIGAQVGSIFKNILAILSGILHQQNYSINTISAMLSFGWQEAEIYNNFMGGKPETLIGLTGLGDLIVTAFSPLSRNFSYGFNLFSDKEHLSNTTVEGLTALNSIIEVIEKEKLNLNLIKELYKLINKKITVEQMIEKVWKDK